MDIEIDLPMNTENSDITFTDVLDWKRTRGVQGEDKNFLILTMSLLYMDSKMNCLHAGIEGFTGSSKSFLVDQAINHHKYGDEILFPKECIFVMSGGSNKAIVRNENEFKGKIIFYIEEFQKLATKEDLLENIKNLSENKKVEYLLPGGEKCVIDRGMSVVYCLAINNAYKKDAETTRRFITLDTDISDDLTRQVIQSKLDRGFFKEENVFITEERTSALKNHIKDCLTVRKIGYDFRNPFFTKKNADLIPAPDTNIRSFVDYFSRLMEASAIFHHKKRVTSGKKIVVNLQDVYNIVSIFGDQFIRDIHGLPPYAENVLRAFNYVQDLQGTEAQKMKANTLDAYQEQDSDIEATASDIHRCVIEKLGIHLDYHSVRETLNTLTDLNFVVINTIGKKSTYRRTDRKIEALEIDFEELFEHGKKNMQKKFPDLYNDWLKLNSEKLYDPITGETLEGLPKLSCFGNVDHKQTVVEKSVKTHQDAMDSITESI